MTDDAIVEGLWMLHRLNIQLPWIVPPMTAQEREERMKARNLEIISASRDKDVLEKDRLRKAKYRQENSDLINDRARENYHKNKTHGAIFQRAKKRRERRERLRQSKEKEKEKAEAKENARREKTIIKLEKERAKRREKTIIKLEKERAKREAENDRRMKWFEYEDRRYKEYLAQMEANRKYWEDLNERKRQRKAAAIERSKEWHANYRARKKSEQIFFQTLDAAAKLNQLS